MSENNKPAVVDPRIQRLNQMFEKATSSLVAVTPESVKKYMTPQRITKIILAAASRNPRLLECSPASIYQACMTATQLGLECDGVMGGAYLVPYRNNKTGLTEAQFQIGYQGLMELARRSGQILSIEAEVVRVGDKFSCRKGIAATIEHEPDWDAEEPGAFRCVYAIARFRDGGYQFVVLTRAEVNDIRKSSKSSKFGPWVDHYEEMAKKSAIKRLCKLLPKSVELRDAVAVEDEIEHDELPSATSEVAGLLGGQTFDTQVLSQSTNDDDRRYGELFDPGHPGKVVHNGPASTESMGAGMAATRGVHTED